MTLLSLLFLLTDLYHVPVYISNNNREGELSLRSYEYSWGMKLCQVLRFDEWITKETFIWNLDRKQMQTHALQSFDENGDAFYNQKLVEVFSRVNVININIKMIAVIRDSMIIFFWHLNVHLFSWFMHAMSSVRATSKYINTEYRCRFQAEMQFEKRFKLFPTKFLLHSHK